MEESSAGTKSAKPKHNKTRNILIDLATLFVVVVIAIMIFVLVGQRDSEYSSSDSTVSIVGLHCERPGVDNQYYTKPTPDSGLHEVSANFNDGELTDIMYSYTGEFPANTDLPQVKTVVHANFDLDQGNRYVHSDGVWSETFSILYGTSVKMSVYSDKSHLRASASHVFGLKPNTPIPTTSETLRSAYEGLGYTCEVRK